MGQLDNVTQQNANLAQQSSRAGDELKRQAGALYLAVEELVVLIDGDGKVTVQKATGDDHGGGKVLTFKSEPSASVPVVEHKVAAGSDITASTEAAADDGPAMPSADDSRFEDL